MTTIFKAALLVVAGAGIFSPLSAADAPKQSVSASAETEDFSQDLGSLRSVKIEYKLEAEDTTVTFTPVLGERQSPAASETSIGAGLAVYQDWSADFSTRTAIFASEEDPVFAQYDVAQDFTLKVTNETLVTLGGRWARFFGDQDVYFASAGARQYFKRGSIAYRLSLVDTEGRRPFLAHLVNLSLNDSKGRGQTRFWLSAGEASFSRPQLGDQFDGSDIGGVIQRFQPIGDKLALTITTGLNRYGRPGQDVTSTTFGVGLTTSFGGGEREPTR